MPKHKKEESSSSSDSSDESSSSKSSSHSETTERKKKRVTTKKQQKHERSRESSVEEDLQKREKLDDSKKSKRTRNDSRSAYENKHNVDNRRKYRDVDRRDRNDDKAHDYRNKSKERDNYHHQRNRGRDYRQNNYRNRYGNNENDDYRRNRREDQHSRNRRGRSRSRSFDHANAKWGKDDKGRDNSGKDKDKEVKKEKEKPNFGLSGKLTEETNTYRGVVIKYSEPPEARKPKRRWRLYPFKGDKALQTLYIHRESAYLIGRDRKVVDLPVDHPSCSKQHAALQYRLVTFTREDGTTGKRVRPYLIDLESANGTFINNKKIEAKKYVELLERDVIKFGFSSREYVLLHENSKDEAQDDDVKVEEEEVPVKKESNE